jgi:hypothetical protein
MKPREEVLQPVDAAAVRLARALLRGARHGALATLAPGSGAPQASRVAVATDMDGAPLILVSALAAHTGALRADPRCALLLGEPGKGDPLAHPRLSLAARARELPRGTADQLRASRRYLARQPRAALYAGFADFGWFRLEPAGASLNGGFARAFALTAGDLLSAGPAAEELAGIEAEAIAHLNADHAEALGLYARHYAGAGDGAWRLEGLDPDGLDLAHGGRLARVWFEPPLGGADELRPRLAAMAAAARGRG